MTQARRVYPVSQTALNTGLGFSAIVLWSTTVALGRSLSEQLGMFVAGALIYGLAGLLGCAVQLARGQLRGTLAVLSPAFLLGSGALFVLYELCLYLALGLSANRAQVVEVALVHYLWPMLTLFLTVLVHRMRAHPLFWVGAVVAMGGVVLAMTQDTALSWSGFWANLAANAAPYAIALVAALTWALYSVSGQRWSGEAHGRAVVVWMLLTGVVLGLVGSFLRATPVPGARVGWELAFMAISANVAYGFWEHAMRKGNVVLVVSASYLTPLLSTIVSSLYLRVGLGIRLWLGCALVVGGAALCNAAVGRRASAGREP